MNIFTDALGQTSFVVDNFIPGKEMVYLNGQKLYKAIDYRTNTTSGAPVGYNDTIDLDPNMFGVGLKYSDDILEVITMPSIEDGLRDINAKLDDILTATMGSLNWDKRGGLMTMFNTQGEPRFKFDVSDNANTSVRERRQDLEL